MRYLVITDVHANAVALEAVLRTPEARSCARVISLGDQVNFGPQPREVLTRLTELNALMLLGNHEERFAHLHEPAFAGYNWRSLHWTLAQVGRLDPADYPGEWRLGPVLCTHGTPGEPYHLIEPEDVTAELDKLPDDVRIMLSGHNHRSWHVAHNGRLGVNPGALGALEEGSGGLAPFLVMDVNGDDVKLERFLAPYDVDEVERAYIISGLAQVAPEVSRAVMQMVRSAEVKSMLYLVQHVQAEAKRLGLPMGDESVWKQADRTWRWPEPMTSEQYWQERRRALHV